MTIASPNAMNLLSVELYSIFTDPSLFSTWVTIFIFAITSIAGFAWWLIVMYMTQRSILKDTRELCTKSKNHEGRINDLEKRMDVFDNEIGHCTSLNNKDKRKGD